MVTWLKLKGKAELAREQVRRAGIVGKPVPTKQKVPSHMSAKGLKNLLTKITNKEPVPQCVGLTTSGAGSCSVHLLIFIKAVSDSFQPGMIL